MYNYVYKIPLGCNIVYGCNDLSDRYAKSCLEHSSVAKCCTKISPIQSSVPKIFQKYALRFVVKRKHCNLGYFLFNADFLLSFIRIPNITYLGHHHTSLLSSNTWSLIYCCSTRTTSPHESIKQTTNNNLTVP